MGNSNSCLCHANKHVEEREGQLHLLYSKKNSSKQLFVRYQEHHVHQPTRLVVREESDGTFHIHAMRHVAEQRPLPKVAEEPPPAASPVLNPAQLFSPSYMATTPRMPGMYI